MNFLVLRHGEDIISFHSKCNEVSVRKIILDKILPFQNNCKQPSPVEWTLGLSKKSLERDFFYKAKRNAV